MSVKLVEINGQSFYRMYVQQRGVENSTIRRQKNLLLPVGTDQGEAKEAALKAEKEWIKKLTQEVAFEENRGLPFGEIVKRWELAARFEHLGKKVEPGTIKDHVNRLHRFCEPWLTKVAAELTKGDGREVLRLADAGGASLTNQRKIKGSINLIYDWAIEEKLVKGVRHSPVYGLILEDDDEESIPPILTLEEVRKLLSEARRVGHPWFPVWAFALLTGMRSGELFALHWSAVNLNNRMIRVFKSYCRRRKAEKSTKSGYWRSVPISPSLLKLVLELKSQTGGTDFVLPRLPGWDDGYAAKILQDFLKKIGIESPAVFHTLRACFATHLLSAGAEATKVMKIGGWRDLKTFQIYVRLAGVDEKGVTDALQVLPNDEAIAERADGMFNAVNGGGISPLEIA